MKVLRLLINKNQSNGQYNVCLPKKKLPKIMKDNTPKSIKVRIEDIEW